MNQNLKALTANMYSPKREEKLSPLFISVEGIDGCGKSSQANLIANYFKELKRDVTLLYEPGGTEFGDVLRSAILNSRSSIDPLAELYLFASSRAQLLKQKTLPLLQKQNNVIIYDRYIDSSLAYQGYGRELGIETVLKAHQFSPLNILPHITFYIEVDIKTSNNRQKDKNKDYFEADKIEFHNKLITGFNNIINIFPNRIKKINGIKSSDEIFNDIKEHLKNL